jgi:murein DD-endopeptidase MepM/ murein hydrolase activator NlpD
MKNKKGIKLILIPESGKEPKYIKLPSFVFFAFKLIIFALMVITVSSIFFGASITKEVITSRKIINERDSLQIVASQVQNIKSNLVAMDYYVKYLRKMADITGTKQLPSLNDFMNSDSMRAKFSEVSSADEFASTPNILPVNGWVSREYSSENNHNALDFVASTGTTIRTTADGVVDSIFVDAHLGNVIVIDHLKGYKTLYAHCSSILSQKGRRIVRGETIALVGNSGKSSSGPHLHYEVLYNDKRINPTNLLILK